MCLGQMWLCVLYLFLVLKKHFNTKHAAYDSQLFDRVALEPAVRAIPANTERKGEAVDVDDGTTSLMR